MLKALFSLVLVFFIVGCSGKNAPEYNKSDIYWYNKMVRYIAAGDLDRADDFFTSLQSEHFSSPLLKEALLILAQAHMDEEEYLLANYYLDEYIKRYADSKEREFATYLKIKASFLAFKNINRDQKLLQDTIEKAEKFKKEYAKSDFVPLVDTILAKLYMTEFVLDEEIASMYERVGKKKAANFYKERLKRSWLIKSQIDVPHSWYDYLINW